MQRRFSTQFVFFTDFLSVFFLLCLSSQIANAILQDNDGSLDYTWTLASGPVDHYDVYVSVDGVNFSLAGATPDATPAYTHTNTTDGTTYSIKIQAVDAFGNTGLFSDVADPVQVNLSKSYTMTIQPGINVISPPLDPGQPWTLGNLLAQAQSDFMVYYDDSTFQYFDSNSPDTIPVQGGVAYIVVRIDSTPVQVTFQGKAWEDTPQSQTFTTTIQPGINMISVPLDPGTPWTLNTLMTQLPIDFIFYYDGTTFQYYDENSVGTVPVQGGEGYIAVSLANDPANFTFQGVAWENTLLLAAPLLMTPTATSFSHTNMLAVVGRIESPALDGVSLLLRNPKTQRTISTQPLEDGSYHFVVFDPFDVDAIAAGGTLEVTITDANRIYQRETFDLKIGRVDIQNHRVVVPSLALTPIPKKTRPLANYPNPFNPETWIPFELARNTEVVISIYGVQGKLIRTLDLGSNTAGVYHTRNRAAYWNGRNDIGERVSSGIYFYTLQTADHISTRRMVLMK